MKKFLLALVLILVLALSGVASATNWGDTYNDNREYTTNNDNREYTTNEGGQGGKGGDADANALAISGSKSEADATAVNLTNVEVKQGPMNQGQVAINEGNKNIIKIENERGYANTVGTSAAELHHGDGKVDWDAAYFLPKIGIPLYNGEEITKQLDIEANVPIKKLIETGLAMKKKQGVLCYNDRLIIVEAEAQKSWSTNGQLTGSGAYTGNAAANAVGGFVPAVGGTKAHNLYTLIIVKVVVKK